MGALSRSNIVLKGSIDNVRQHLFVERDSSEHIAAFAASETIDPSQKILTVVPEGTGASN
jgi:hypothetical protein